MWYSPTWASPLRGIQKRPRNNAFRPRCLLQSRARTRGNGHFSTRRCLLRGKIKEQTFTSTSFGSDPDESEAFRTPATEFSFSRFSRTVLFLFSLSYVRVYVCLAYARVRVFRCTRVRVDTSLEGSLQTEFRFALRASISHATWSSVFYSSPWDVRAPFLPFRVLSGRERRRTYGERRAHTRARKAARNLNGFRG